LKKTAITGGIGSGKSYVARLLKRRGIDVYDCDAAAKRLMRHDPELRRQLTALIGPDCYLASESGQQPTLNKAAVAQFLLASE
jgi:dephospho-CoA kinase